MGTLYASGKLAWGICDRCGFRVLLNTLRSTIILGKPTGVMVCRTCHEPDHPQLWVGRQQINDPQALKNPRSDVAERDASRELINQVNLDDITTTPR